MIVAVFADEDSPLIGLRNLVMPLRASNIPYTALLQVVLVGNVKYIKRKLFNLVLHFVLLFFIIIDINFRRFILKLFAIF